MEGKSKSKRYLNPNEGNTAKNKVHYFTPENDKTVRQKCDEDISQFKLTGSEPQKILSKTDIKKLRKTVGRSVARKLGTKPAEVKKKLINYSTSNLKFLKKRIISQLNNQSIYENGNLQSIKEDINKNHSFVGSSTLRKSPKLDKEKLSSKKKKRKKKVSSQTKKKESLEPETEESKKIDYEELQATFYKSYNLKNLFHKTSAIRMNEKEFKSSPKKKFENSMIQVRFTAKSMYKKNDRSYYQHNKIEMKTISEIRGKKFSNPNIRESPPKKKKKMAKSFKNIKKKKKNKENSNLKTLNKDVLIPPRESNTSTKPTGNNKSNLENISKRIIEKTKKISEMYLKKNPRKFKSSVTSNKKRKKKKTGHSPRSPKYMHKLTEKKIKLTTGLRVRRGNYKSRTSYSFRDKSLMRSQIAQQSIGLFQQRFNTESKLLDNKVTDRTLSTANESVKATPGLKSDSFYSLIFESDYNNYRLGHKAHKFVHVMCQNMRDFDNRFPMGISHPHRTVNLPNKKFKNKKKTLIFDLDETLIHCSFKDIDSKGDTSIKLPFKQDSAGKVLVSANLFIRPYAVEILEELSKDFEILIFTSSQKHYAKRVIKKLDPKMKYISFILTREHCNMQKKLMIKDLRIIANRNIEEMLIVDNCVGGFANQVRNGIPIFPYEGQNNDKELLLLKDYIQKLTRMKEGTLAENNSKTFKLSKLRYFTDPQEYINYVKSDEI